MAVRGTSGNRSATRVSADSGTNVDLQNRGSVVWLDSCIEMKLRTAVVPTVPRGMMPAGS